jgi:sulfotransferase family protein
VPQNHVFTAKIWQSSAVRRARHSMSLTRIGRRLTAGSRRLPNYLVAGAQKCGTTSLWSYLNEHPCVVPAMTKEMHFFDNNYHRGIGWYRAHFPRLTSSSDLSLPQQMQMTGESSAYYLFHPLAPQRIHETVPKVKIILLLRNPIDRAFSHYQLKLRRRQEALSFEGAIAAEADRLAGEEDRIRQEKNYYSAAHDRHSYLARGRYLDQILRYQRFFSPDQLLILESGELFRHTSDVFHRVLNFLGLPAFEPPHYGNRFPGKYHDRMKDATRQRLIDYFAPYNEQLYAHLGTRFDWR